MVSLIVSPHRFVCPRSSIFCLNGTHVSPVLLLTNALETYLRPRKPVCLSFGLTEDSSFRFVEVNQRGSSFFGFKRIGFGDSYCCWCKGGEDCDGEEAALEEKMLEFMRKSEKPEIFPTKKELIDAGRMDLVEEIRRIGGWLSWGWNSDDENHGNEQGSENEIVATGCDVKNIERRVESSLECNSFQEEDRSSNPSSVPLGSSQLASSSARSFESENEKGTGIEGILNRLEKERNLSFGIDLEKSVHGTRVLSKVDGGASHLSMSEDADRAYLEETGRLAPGSSYTSSTEESGSMGPLLQLDSDSLNPGMWRIWSSQRAGVSNEEFQAAEISFTKNHIEEERNDLEDSRVGISQNAGEVSEIWNNTDHTNIRARLQNLELELASALQSLRHRSVKLASTEDDQNSSNDLLKLSDELEFKENEIITEQDKLRSMRAQIAVLEGKMALALIGAQRISEEKQKRADGARRALQLLRTICIIWPSPASEVLLVGSFDGWTTKRKMQKTSAGIFSVCLKLYPGKYEMKFIVDGIWRIDPLRPIVYNNGYENNLLTIT